MYYNYPEQKYQDNGKSKYSTLAHEYGHFFDGNAKYKGLHFSEVNEINNRTKYAKLRVRASSSDEFLEAVRKDRSLLKTTITNDSKKEIRRTESTVGVQDAVDGLLADRFGWGHGDKYYNRVYNRFKRLGEHKTLQSVYKKQGLDASNLGKTAMECRIYDSASEMWANIMSAEVNGGDELEAIKKYLPNSYEAMIKILEGVE